MLKTENNNRFEIVTYVIVQRKSKNVIFFIFSFKVLNGDSLIDDPDVNYFLKSLSEYCQHGSRLDFFNSRLASSCVKYQLCLALRHLTMVIDFVIITIAIRITVIIIAVSLLHYNRLSGLIPVRSGHMVRFDGRRQLRRTVLQHGRRTAHQDCYGRISTDPNGGKG